MRNGLWTKGLVIGIIILFIGMSIFPNISGTYIKISDKISVDKTIKSSISKNLPLDFEHPFYPSQPSKYRRSLNDILTGNNSLSLTGSRPVLVILYEYSDIRHDASHDRNFFEQMMWGTKPSVSTYYSEVSYGKFTFISAGIIGWYQTGIKKSDSGAESKTLIYTDENFNFAPYDINKDGLVSHEELTLVFVEASDSFERASWIEVPSQKISTNDGVVLEYSCCSMTEKDIMGAFAHELGHSLGLPDLYDYGFDSYGVGDYDLMSYGGDQVSHLSAWCKIQLGWLTPTIINTRGTYTLHDVETHPEAFILCDKNHSIYEYFLIENRWKGDSYDAGVPDEGTLIYHIDDKQFSLHKNEIEQHKGVDVECADKPSSHFINADHLDSKENYGDENDLWDSSTYDFDDWSIPCNAIWYDGKPSKCAVHFLSAPGPTMNMYISANFGNQNHPPEIPTIKGPASGIKRQTTTYDFTTRDYENDQVYYYIDWGDGNNSGWIGRFDSGARVTQSHTWFTNGTYNITAKAKDSYNQESDWATLTVTMPCSYNKPIQQFLDWLLQRFPNAFPLIRHLLGY